MNSWIDFKELRQQLDFAALLRFYKVEPKVKGDQHHGFCPLPNHNGNRNSASFSANVKKGIWQCFGCGAKGNALDFAILMEGGNPEDSKDARRVALKLRDELIGGTRAAPPQKLTGEHESPMDASVNVPLDFTLKGLDPQHPYLRARGFLPETIARFDLGYCARGMLKERVAIPLHDQAGRLVGYAGRVIDDSTITEENPRYKLPGRREHKGVVYEFRKSLFLYNGYRISSPVADLVVVEGFTGVWWLVQSGIENVVAPMGASCSEEQAKLIVSATRPDGRVWILSDGDTAGVRLAEETMRLVVPHRFIRWMRLDKGAQPTSLSPEELKRRFCF